MEVNAIFIDRDGVINKDPGGWTKHNYVTDWEDFHFIEGSIEALKILKERGVKVIIASNQGGVSKGVYSKEKLAEITGLMLKEIEARGGAIEEVFYCVHKDEDNCSCRKPKPGLLEMAATKYGIDPKTTFFIGDDKKDILAGKAAGCKTALVLSGKSSRDMAQGWAERPDYISKNLLEVVKELTKDYLLT